jgi:hypothetical protein
VCRKEAPGSLLSSLGRQRCAGFLILSTETIAPAERGCHVPGSRSREAEMGEVWLSINNLSLPPSTYGDLLIPTRYFVSMTSLNVTATDKLGKAGAPKEF